MTTLLFYFSGTGDNGVRPRESMERFNAFNDDDVIRIYFPGCQHKNIGKSTIFPDFEELCDFIAGSFSDKTFQLDLLQKKLDGVAVIVGNTKKINNIAPNKLVFMGFSRGAITCFALAKKLNKLCIPMYVMTNQPVTGDVNPYKEDSLFKKYENLTSCTFVENAVTFLGSYHRENTSIENTYFKQMIPFYHADTNIRNIEFPFQSHIAWFNNDLIAIYNLKLLVLWKVIDVPKSKSKLTGQLAVADLDGSIRNVYHGHPELCFTPLHLAQTILCQPKTTIERDPLFFASMREFIEPLYQKEIQLTIAQTYAIYALTKTTLSHDSIVDLSKMITSGEKKAEYLTKIINMTHEMTEYIMHLSFSLTDDMRDAKYVEHYQNYRKNIYNQLVILLSYDAPTKEHINQFNAKIMEATELFKKSSMGMTSVPIAHLVDNTPKMIINNLLGGLSLLQRALAIKAPIVQNFSIFTKTNQTKKLEEHSQHIIEEVEKALKPD